MPLPSSRKPSAIDPDLFRDRARGALLGLATGDALGTTLEFKALPAPPFPQLCDGPHQSMVGKGPFQLLPGQVTDDTQMATALASSLKTVKAFSADDVLQRYRAWLPHAFDVGNQTRAALEGHKPALGPFFAAKEHWLHNGKKPAGNGSLMRTAPIGVFFASDRAARIRASLEDSALTHADPKCQLACAAYNAAIAHALTSSEDVEARALVSAAASELSVAAAELGRRMPDATREVQDALAALKEDLRFAEKPDPLLYGPEVHLHHHQGFVRVAFRLAFWELLHAPTFQAGVVDAVNRGGDADTNGAIVGALLGALHGESRIPGDWRGPVLTVAPRSPAFRETYHPATLLTLVD